MNLSRITRLVELIGLLQASSGQNAHALATACGVSRRTIFRDLETLRAAGVPLRFDEELGEYRIPGTYFLPPTNFSVEEALAVLVLCHELGDEGQVPFFAAARSAALKLESALPSRLRDRLREITGAIKMRIDATAPAAEHTPIYHQLLDAVGQRQCVRISYRSVYEDGEICLKLSPYRLLFSRRGWYCIGRSSIHRATRTFNVARISKLEPLDDKYRIPRGFSLKRYLRNAWHLIPEPGPDAQVRIRFGKLVARNVAEVAWHPTQETRFLRDGSLEFRATVSGLNEISWWILGYGPQAEVLAPAKLRRLVAQRATEMAELYNGPS
ncbi:MAG: YafY family transcriptional regulator [Planctomycetota bacterium]|nr:MAG: YafY family transcriptional regulator [Planctomycetota bacterium]REJ93226.1 MAG: YafY family transcriptional regulator [Planctomycetota bacterium]REK26037.1 MAG: YafY family transcriptional regulator [Planctomycetota bacterium]REK49436.1 MAG: YafY family transcriptional regulator [Planctomycetota bacterium]